jgi:hypothetical protein
MLLSEVIRIWSTDINVSMQSVYQLQWCTQRHYNEQSPSTFILHVHLLLILAARIILQWLWTVTSFLFWGRPQVKSICNCNWCIELTSGPVQTVCACVWVDSDWQPVSASCWLKWWIRERSGGQWYRKGWSKMGFTYDLQVLKQQRWYL